MSDRLNQAMELEKEYQQYRLKGEEPFHLVDRIVELGYQSLDEYFAEKNSYLFSQWIPEIRYDDIAKISTVTEQAIVGGEHCVFIPIVEGLYAYHGTDAIDYDLCEKLGVRVVEMNYQGGTIVGSAEDFSFEIIAPVSIGLEPFTIINKMHEIISKYVDNVTISGNDLLVNGEKVMGSMERRVGNSSVWAAQVSFGDYSEIIEQICNKKSTKKPSYIDSAYLTRDMLEKEVLKWLCKL